MFSGIIEELGHIDIFSEKNGGGAKIVIAPSRLGRKASVGDSISVNGVCLTVVSSIDNRLAFDLSDETLRVSNLGELSAGDKINLELSLKVGDRLGGHFVSGHVDEIGRIVEYRDEGDCFVFRIGASDKILELLVDRGSISVDGISLTVTKVLKDAFEIVIIPHTAKVTTLGIKRAGDSVNLEADMIGKYVAKLVVKD